MTRRLWRLLQLTHSPFCSVNIYRRLPSALYLRLRCGLYLGYYEPSDDGVGLGLAGGEAVAAAAGESGGEGEADGDGDGDGEGETVLLSGNFKAV
jgi:hypothetical protein